jgi:hypothetical protein
MRMNFRSIWLIIVAVRKSVEEMVIDCFVAIVSRRGIGCSSGV